MIKNLLPLIIILGLISCNKNPKNIDYFGQTKPDTIPVIFAKGIISQEGRFEHGISFTPDAKEMVFGILNKNDFSGDIYYSKKLDEKWSKPSTFKPLENKSVFLPYFSPNGNSMVFTQSKWDTAFHYKDLWIIKKNNQTWENPEKMKVPIHPEASVSNGCISLDGTVYFSTNINCLGVENCPTADLFYSELIDNKYQPAKAIPEFISTNDEESVFISPKEDYIIFCRYTDNKSWMDLYISYRDTNNKWTEPKIVDSSINSTDWDRRPFVTIDNKYLFFTRLQIGEKGLTESDIYWVNTSKLFKPYVCNPLPDITAKVGKKFEIAVPKDYFKDIDDKQLNIKINQNEFDWLEFDKRNMKLTAFPITDGEYDLEFTAIDKSSNRVGHTIKIKVTK